VTMSSSHPGDGVAGVTWSWCDVEAESCWRCCCQGNLATSRCRCRVMFTAVLSSHAGDGAVEVTLSWCDVDVKSCWR
jgi:hypothetical protein